MIDFLVLIKSFVEICLTCLARPKYVPIMAICMNKIVGLKERSHQFYVCLQNFVHQLMCLAISGFCESHGWRTIFNQLWFFEIFELYHIRAGTKCLIILRPHLVNCCIELLKSFILELILRSLTSRYSSDFKTFLFDPLR